MVQFLLVSLATGLTSAVLFVLSAKGTVLAMLLAWLTPLPIMIAAMGFGPLAGLVSALAGSVMIGAGLRPVAGLVFAIGLALPAWWLGSVSVVNLFGPALKDLNTPQKAGQTRTYHRSGSILGWIGLLSAATLTLALIALSVSHGSYSGAMDVISARLKPELGPLLDAAGQMSGNVSSDDMIRIFLVMAPGIAAMSSIIMLAGNLWTAGRIVQISQRLERPWPSLPDDLRLPMAVSLLAPIALVASFLPGIGSAIALVVGCCCIMLLALQGLAVIHVLTRGFGGRFFLLFTLYGVIFLAMPWPLILLALFGFADSFLNVRERWKSPPASIPNS